MKGLEEERVGLRRERTEGLGSEGREEEGSGTGKATFSLSLGLVESPSGRALQLLCKSQGLFRAQ